MTQEYDAACDRIRFLEKALEQVIDLTGMSILPSKEVEVKADGFTGRVTSINVLPEGFECAPVHLRGIDDHPELAAYLKEKEEGA